MSGLSYFYQIYMCVKRRITKNPNGIKITAQVWRCIANETGDGGHEDLPVNLSFMSCRVLGWRLMLSSSLSVLSC
jgi:hypothetical protein